MLRSLSAIMPHCVALATAHHAEARWPMQHNDACSLQTCLDRLTSWLLGRHRRGQQQPAYYPLHQRLAGWQSDQQHPGQQAQIEARVGVDPCGPADLKALAGCPPCRQQPRWLTGQAALLLMLLQGLQGQSCGTCLSRSPAIAHVYCLAWEHGCYRHAEAQSSASGHGSGYGKNCIHLIAQHPHGIMIRCLHLPSVTRSALS